ncbi:hypothetical protein TB2_014026 [Malus domestica]
MAFALGSINFADYECAHVGLRWSTYGGYEHEVKAENQQLISGVWSCSLEVDCRLDSHHVFNVWISNSSECGSLCPLLTGLIRMVISFIMGLIKTTASANSFLKSFFRLSPGFCFADGLASLALLQQDMKDKSSNQAFGWNVTGGSICYLGIESICYFLLTLGLELLLSNKWTLATLKECWNSIGSIKHGTPSYLESLLKISSDVVTLDLDEDKDRKN